MPLLIVDKKLPVDSIGSFFLCTISAKLEETTMGLTDDQRDEALKALRGAQEAMEYLMKGVKGLDEANTLRGRIDEVELYLKRAKMALRFI